MNGAVRTFPFNTNVTVTTLGGTCTTAAGVNPDRVGRDPRREHTERHRRLRRRRLDLHAHDRAAPPTAVRDHRDPIRHREQRRNVRRAVDHRRQDHPVVALTTVNGTARTFPYISNATVTTVGGTCGAAIGDSPTVSVAIAGTSNQNGTANCTAGTWTYSPTTALSADGAYTVTTTQTDIAGNTGTTGAESLTVDRTLPGDAHERQRHRPHVPVHDEHHCNFRRRRVRHRRR